MYDKIHDKGIKRERHSLSHARHHKMKALILREIRDAIVEADHEPSISIMDSNML